MDNKNNQKNETSPNAGTCGQPTEVYSRVTGYFRPVSNWNHGKKEEFKDRRTFRVTKKEKYFDPVANAEIETADVEIR